LTVALCQKLAEFIVNYHPVGNIFPYEQVTAILSLDVIGLGQA